LPRLLLQPLVENAVLHGISRLPEGGRVVIGIALEFGTLQISVSNPAPEPETWRSGGSGHAQRSIGHRLAYAFGPEAQMTAGWDAGYYRVELRLPVPREESIS
jgi:two-component system sensor histidine kinase AlgZ